MGQIAGQNVSCLASLLPYIECGNIWAEMDLGTPSTTNGVSIFDITGKAMIRFTANAWAMAQTKIPASICPSDQPIRANPVTIIIVCWIGLAGYLHLWERILFRLGRVSRLPARITRRLRLVRRPD